MGAPSIRGRRVAGSFLLIAFALGALGATGEPVGAAGAAEPDVSASVVGGKPIAVNQFPALAAILLAGPRSVPAQDRLLCTGTVIARRWILSAGHCSQAVLFGEPLIVQAGRPDLGDPRAIVAHVNRAVVHRNFMKSGVGYDVALFHVATDINVPMARLAVAADLPRMAVGQPATIVGWGLTKRLALQEFPAPDARPPVRARAVTVPIVADATCVDVYRDFYPHFVVPGSDLCAGYEGHDACYGDSGGPLYTNDSEGRLVEIGLTSRGAGCATKLFPGVFTDVRRMHGWIHRWTTRPCPTRFEFPPDPDFPIDFPTGPLFVC